MPRIRKPALVPEWRRAWRWGSMRILLLVPLLIEAWHQATPEQREALLAGLRWLGVTDPATVVQLACLAGGALRLLSSRPAGR